MYALDNLEVEQSYFDCLVDLPTLLLYSLDIEVLDIVLSGKKHPDLVYGSGTGCEARWEIGKFGIQICCRWFIYWFMINPILNSIIIVL